MLYWLAYQHTLYSDYTVGTECCHTGDLSPAICRSHHWRVGHSSLAVRFGGDRIKIAVLTFRVLRGSAPPYLGPLVPAYAVFPADGHFVLQAIIVFWCHWSSDQPSVAVLSRLLAQRPGKPPAIPSQNKLFAAIPKRGFSRSLFGHLILTASWLLA